MKSQKVKSPYLIAALLLWVGFNAQAVQYCVNCGGYMPSPYNNVMLPGQMPSFMPPYMPPWGFVGASAYSNFYFPGAWGGPPPYSNTYMPGYFPGMHGPSYPGQGNVVAMKPNIYLGGKEGTEFRVQPAMAAGTNLLVVAPILQKEGWKGKITADQALEIDGATHRFQEPGQL